MVATALIIITVHRTGSTYKKLASSSGDVLANRQTDTQTDMLIAISRSPAGAQ